MFGFGCGSVQGGSGSILVRFGPGSFPYRFRFGSVPVPVRFRFGVDLVFDSGLFFVQVRRVCGSVHPLAVSSEVQRMIVA